MCDTIKIYFPITIVNKEECNKQNYPLQRAMFTNQDGEIVSSFTLFTKVVSPLTYAKYQVKAVFVGGDPRSEQIIGYLVDINIPACTIGNNVLLQNIVWSASRLAMYLLKHWLLTNGCTKAGVDAIKIVNARLKSVTLTYLFLCDDHDDALARNKELLYRGEVLRNPRGKAKANKNNVYQVGTSDESTVYCKGREFNINSYVKSQTIQKASAEFANKDVEHLIYAEGKRHLRVEIDFGEKWLKDNDCHDPANWKGSNGRELRQLGIKLIRQYLRLDEKLRTNRPKPSYIDQLSITDQDILVWHLDGNDVLQHKLIAAKGKKYFSAVKLRLLKKLRIDITIPWQEQSIKLSPQLSELITDNGQYQPLHNLTAHTLCVKTVPDLIRKLKKLIEIILNKRAVTALAINKRAVSARAIKVKSTRVAAKRRKGISLIVANHRSN